MPENYTEITDLLAWLVRLENSKQSKLIFFFAKKWVYTLQHDNKHGGKHCTYLNIIVLNVLAVRGSAWILHLFNL